MNRNEYEQHRQRIISDKRSLIMQVRQWRNRRPNYAQELQAKLDSLTTPHPLPKVYGYELTDADGCFAGFTLDYDEAVDSGLKFTKQQAICNIGHLPI